jgi:DNA-binding GntR family transcriptional regulator
VFKKIEQRGIVPQVYEQLRKAILRGKLEAGSRLVESHIADELGVSRTPVREAISRLVAQGFVKEIEGGVRIVADMEVEIREVFAIRQLLEGFAVRLAAENASPEELDEIERLCEASVRAVDSTSIAERAALNNIFHGAIAKASQSERLIKIINNFYEYAITEEMMPFYGSESTRKHVEQHRDIARALKARQPDKAEAIMKDHLGEIMNTIENAIRRVRSGEIQPEDVDPVDESQIENLISNHSK